MKYIAKFLMAAALTMIGTLAYAIPISISPGGEIDSGLIAGSPYNTNSNSIVKAYIESTYGVSQLYKDNAGGIEEGVFLSSYETTFSNSSSDPSDALIEYVGGDKISCPQCYLVVKDGNHSPWWYLFDLGTWDGMMDIDATGFWPNGGAISHVAIYGTPGRQVPEPGPLALLAIGLLGVGLRQLKKSV